MWLAILYARVLFLLRHSWEPGTCTASSSCRPCPLSFMPVPAGTNINMTDPKRGKLAEVGWEAYDRCCVIIRAVCRRAKTSVLAQCLLVANRRGAPRGNSTSLLRGGHQCVVICDPPTSGCPPLKIITVASQHNRSKRAQRKALDGGLLCPSGLKHVAVQMVKGFLQCESARSSSCGKSSANY